MQTKRLLLISDRVLKNDNTEQSNFDLAKFIYICAPGRWYGVSEIVLGFVVFLYCKLFIII